jgi:hypothetical protein
MLNHEASTDSLVDEISAVAVHIAQHTARFLELLGELDRRGVHAQYDCRTMADWLAFRVQMSLGAAREHLRVARALRELPRTMEAFKQGVVSYSHKVRAITRVADAAGEEAILQTARYATAAQLERILAGVHRAGAGPRVDVEARRQAMVFFDEDGMLVVRARLAPEEGATLLRALDEARRELWEQDPAERPAEQARADAFALIADKALGGKPRSGGDRQMVIVHVDQEVLRSPDVSGESRLADGAGVPAETSRRLACDCSVIEDGGRRTRTLGAALRRALERRDQGRCRFPGCSCRIVDAHHVEHWANGGATELGNLCSLCRSCHRRVHEGGYRVEMVDGQPRFYRPDGRPIAPAPPPTPARPELRLDAAQIAADRLTLVSRWDGSRPDYPEAVASLL